MKILFLTIGNEAVASSRTRVYGYLPFLTKANILYKILVFTSRAKQKRILELKRDDPLHYTLEVFYKIYIIIQLFIFSREYEIVYVQKVILPKALWLILQKLNKKIIFDFDDAIFLYKDITYLLRSAASCVVSNKALKEYAFKYNKKVYELISPVNISKQFPGRKVDSVTLGWIGSPETSKYLYPLIPVFKTLKERFHDLNIELMGAANNRCFDPMDVNIAKWSLKAEKGHFERVDVGIMPLEDNEWARSKAGYKLLLYMSKGIPCIAAPVGINKEIVRDGITGFFANSNEEWLNKITIFLKDDKLRKQIGEKGRQYVKEHFSYKAVLPKFLNILNSCEKL